MGGLRPMSHDSVAALARQLLAQRVALGRQVCARCPGGLFAQARAHRDAPDAAPCQHLLAEAARQQRNKSRQRH